MPDDISDLKLEVIKKSRIRENLLKNYERREKLNLADSAYKNQILSEIKNLDNEIAFLNRKIRSKESEEVRRKMINRK